MKYLLMILGIITLLGCKSEMDNTIKNGHFDNCQDGTVEELVEEFFTNTNWESFVSPDDNKYHLNVSGEINVNEKPAKALIQFEMIDDKNWQINAFTIDGEGQTDEMISELVTTMCNELPERQTGQ
jgi:type II secretory pathway component GspD/PulD (secretin)